ncbi:MAG: hypothetical protein WC075_06290, partial [Dehalococcoidales bacterium]
KYQASFYHFFNVIVMISLAVGGNLFSFHNFSASPQTNNSMIQLCLSVFFTQGEYDNNHIFTEIIYCSAEIRAALPVLCFNQYHWCIMEQLFLSFTWGRFNG